MIKNIIFDVGDVLLEYRWKAMMMDYGLTEKEAIDLGEKIFNNQLWKIMDLATKTESEVIAEYKKQYPKEADVIEWFITHGEFMQVARQDVWEGVHTLKEKGYGIYLLSNYSENLFNKHTKGASFKNDIDGMVVSYQIHIAKPDERIYYYILDKYNLKAEECIFYDDRAENTEAAIKVGIKAVTITSKQQLMELMDEMAS